MSSLAAPYNNAQTTSAQTANIVATKARTRPDVAAAFAAMYGAGGNVVSTINNLAGNTNTALQSIDKYAYNYLRTIGSNQASIGRTTNKVVTNVRTGLGEGFEQFTDTLDQVGTNIRDTLKPVSTALGSTLGTLTGIARDPLGSIALLPRGLADIVEKVNPEFAARMEGTFKKYKIDNLVHMPSQLVGSLRNLLTLADAVLSLPFIILADLYQGLKDILDDIADLIDKAIEKIVTFILEDVLGSLIPIDEILEFLAAVSELASEIQGITTIFLGANPVAGFALDVQNYSRLLSNTLSNPVNLLTSYLPPQVAEFQYVLRNPQELINSILPPQLSSAFAQLQSVIGVGFNGNMGYGFEAVLNFFATEGVINGILSRFANQYGILRPLVGLTDGSPIQAAFPPLFKQSVVNPNGHPTAQGIPQPQDEPPPPLPTGP